MNQSQNSITTPIPNLGSIVLCGGQSSRLGLDKSQLIFQGETLLERVASCVATCTYPVVLAAGDNRLISQAAKVALVHDETPTRGPLEGIRVGLNELASQVEFAFVCACDTPLLQPALISQLFDLIGEHQAVVPFSGQTIYGTTAIYRTDIGAALKSLIDQNQLRVMDLENHFDVRKVEIETFRNCDPDLDSFININSREDYFQLLRRFGEEIPSTVAMKFSSRNLIDE